MSFFSEHGTKLYGGLTALFGTVGGLVTTGAFRQDPDPLLSAVSNGWVGIICTVATAVLGAMTLARGFNNSTQEKVASAMETAIKSTPPQE